MNFNFMSFHCLCVFCEGMCEEAPLSDVDNNMKVLIYPIREVFANVIVYFA